MKLKILLLTFYSAIALAVNGQTEEKILIVTDKQWYYPGEKIRFSLNVLNSCTNKPLKVSRIIYTELAGENNTQAVQVKVEDGHGAGSIEVSNNSSTGTYMLRAYTHATLKNTSQNKIGLAVKILNPTRPSKIPRPNNTEWMTNGPVQISTNNSTGLLKKRGTVELNISAQATARLSLSIFRLDSLENGECSHEPSLFDKDCSTSGLQSQSAPPAHDTYTVSARVVDRKTNNPAAGIRAYLSVIGQPQLLFSATSDSSGNLNFTTGVVTGKNEFVVQTAPADSNSSILLEAIPQTKVANVGSAGDWDVFVTNPVTVGEALTASQVQARFADDIKTLPLRNDFDTTPFYGAADAFYRMKDYVRFTSVEDILREYVTTVGVQNRRGKPVPLVVDAYSLELFDRPPLVLINGVPLFDIAAFMEMDPDDFESIAVVTRRFHIGYDVFDGIIDVRLNKAINKIPRNASVVDFEGVQQDAGFEVAQYATDIQRSDRRPDFRTVLYWTPNFQIEKGVTTKIVAYTSDLEGKYAVVAHGVTEDGNPVCSKKIIEVE